MLACGFSCSCSHFILNRKRENNKINVSLNTYMHCAKFAKMQNFCSQGIEKLYS